MTGIGPQTNSVSDQPRVLTKATARAADKLGISNRRLAVILGLSESTISRLKKGDFQLDPSQKAFELSVLFVRLFRSLDALVSGDEQVARSWLRNQNAALRGIPLELIQSVTGLVNVIQYLDARRASI
jgi:Protein of unknown function (DUF2384)